MWRMRSIRKHGAHDAPRTAWNACHNASLSCPCTHPQDHVATGLVELVYFSNSWEADAALFKDMYK